MLIYTPPLTDLVFHRQSKDYQLNY